MTEVFRESLAAQARRLFSRELSARELVAAHLERIRAVEPRVGALVEVRDEAALAEADASDAARARGAAVSPLAGLPVIVKCNLTSPDLETSCASRILRGFRAPFEAGALARLRAAGMIVLATSNMDEFAMGSSCENSALGITRNPWDLSRVPGGSSGGSAAALAAREAPAALGSDTGGSIRQPAALCGVVGLKPTYGRVSRYGLVAFASSLDQIGPLARSASDAALLLRAIAGHDPRDATSLADDVPDYPAALDGAIGGLRIGLPREYFAGDGVDPAMLAAVHEAAALLERRGAKLVDVGLPHTRYGIAAYYLIATAEASSNLARYDGVKYGLRAPAETLEQMYRRTRSEGFGAEVKRRILLGSFVLSAGYYDAYYRKAQQVRTLLRRDFEAAFERCDLLLTPTTPGPAWRIGERVADPLEMYMSDVFTVGVNLAGLPGLSVPCGLVGGLPVGMQLIGRPLDEETILRVGDAYQRETDWHERAPDL
jgi:aspartyl-tRNA(Asn)/glutamyl-tRNA(Gln) amidotransferase subunit A